ncbi:MAG: threonine/serine dehydratase [Henriciella sp.]|nr:threonine/serine dehydratase [Henriciella sp.]
MPEALPRFEDVLAARERTQELVRTTPIMRNDALNATVGADVYIKVETFQRTGAFKFRGATSKMTKLNAEERARGVIAYSTGNHGMAVAEAARLLNVPATVVMPIDTPAIKVEAVKASGASVVSCDRFKENGEEIAKQLAIKEGRTFFHPFNDADVIAGQGTLALEMVEQVRALGADLDALLICSAGGGFAAGCALALEAVAPNTGLYTVEAEHWDALHRSHRAGLKQDNLQAKPSLCDAIQARAPGDLGYAVLKDRWAGTLTVSDDQAVEAVRFAFRHLKLVLEPGAAVGLAALLSDLAPRGAKRIGVVPCGANVDPEKFASYLTTKTLEPA